MAADAHRGQVDKQGVPYQYLCTVTRNGQQIVVTVTD